ncbi:MAG TPA: hypothetical protein DIT64_02310 [Verrucomicrobiales bacterium]|nr:hypothetical protein [Verrucomicrobiales bacterium]HCN76411.1 hypothetical protein [Verrucomicrobiales bacterium]HRJ08202.1 hypothetical protein [Prosthecobacter sp.]HRK16125.1 hypothetical protein [Prosthecobacter sp.]
MNPQTDALEHLRVIRSLMEKAHIYRAISAPAALAGGLLALALSGWQAARAFRDLAPADPCSFAAQWLAVLMVTSVLNFALLSREARRRGQPFVSDGMRAALRALCPPLLAGGVLGLGLMLRLHNLTLGALVWVVCHGLALLATAGFSPRSLIRLGWAFLTAGLALFLIWAVRDDIRLLPSDEGPAAVIMGLTFGLLHLIYAAAVFARRGSEGRTGA